MKRRAKPKAAVSRVAKARGVKARSAKSRVAKTKRANSRRTKARPATARRAKTRHSQKPRRASAPRVSSLGDGLRSVTILGATGSVGSSTVDLLKRQPDRFAVEAVTAHKNGVALAQLARDLGARFAAVADPDAYKDLKAEPSGSGIEAASGPTRSPRRRAVRRNG